MNISSFFAENVVRGNAVQKISIFPPKVLVCRRKNFSSHIFID